MTTVQPVAASAPDPHEVPRRDERALLDLDRLIEPGSADALALSVRAQSYRGRAATPRRWPTSTG